MLMLGGICERTALHLLHTDKIKHFRIRNKYGWQESPAAGRDPQGDLTKMLGQRKPHCP